MTFKEALEYLNLPANSSEQLVKKRYQELKRDYLKAINNAPSEHFSTLYQENLDKIEQAYVLLREESKAVEEINTKISLSIKQAREMVQSFLEEEKNGNLNPKARDEIQAYIDQINVFQQGLKEDQREQQEYLANFSSKSSTLSKPDVALLPKEKVSRRKSRPSAAKFKVDKKANRLKNLVKRDLKIAKIKSVQPKRNEPIVKPTPNSTLKEPGGIFLEQWFVEITLKTAIQLTTSRMRRQFYDRVVAMVILGILLLGALGFIYMIFPLFTA